jgi:hypothetical protein
MADRNPWLRGSLEHNPYYWTAFRVLRMSPAIRTGQALRQRIVEMKNLVRLRPEAVQIRGVPVTAAQVQQAAELLGDSSERFAEELLSHVEESYRTDMLSFLAERLEQLDPDASGLQPRYLEMVRTWLQQQSRPVPEGPEDRELGLLAHIDPDPLRERGDEHG